MFRPTASAAALPDGTVSRSNPLHLEEGSDSSAMVEPDEHVDVVVVGGGVSGLAAAAAVAGGGATSVVVLEASDRLGGRTFTEPEVAMACGPHYCDLGGQWVSPSTQPHVTELLRRLGIAVFPQYIQGRHVVHLAPGAPLTYTGLIPTCLGAMATLDMGSVLAWVHLLTATAVEALFDVEVCVRLASGV
jgi:monoamine oxidase